LERETVQKGVDALIKSPERVNNLYICYYYWNYISDWFQFDFAFLKKRVSILLQEIPIQNLVDV